MPAPKGYYTDRQGRIRPITGKSGGKTAGFTAAASLAIAGATSSGTLGGTSLEGAMSSGGLGNSAGAKSVQAQTKSGKQEARKGKRKQAWKKMNLRVTKRTVKSNIKCSARSFGAVQQFLLRTPCRSLKRTILVLADPSGGSVVVSIAWVRMPNARNAERLKQLDNRDGTGDIYAAANGLLSRSGVNFTGEHYRSRRSGSLFVRAEAAQMRGNPAPTLLNGAAAVAVELPPP